MAVDDNGKGIASTSPLVGEHSLEAGLRPEELSDFGDWMVVKKPPRRKTTGRVETINVQSTQVQHKQATFEFGSTSKDKTGSRFNALINLGQDDALKDIIRTYKPSVFALIETHMGGDHAEKVQRIVGYDSHARVDAVGFRGVYASPDPHNRRELWTELAEFARRNNHPWMVAGDFNETRNLTKRHGGDANMARRCDMFNSWIEDCELIELEFSGAAHTWSRGNSVETRQSARLDRALCNSEWSLLFEDANVKHLPAIQSDHCPLLISPNGFAPLSSVQKPFRFQAAWLTHENFTDFVVENWQPEGYLTAQLGSLSTKLQTWNEQVFGNIFRKKRELFTRINGCQKKLAITRDKGTIVLEAKLCKELDEILESEEILWYQKSRVEFIRDGDRNTSYFHNGEPTEMFTPSRGVRQGDPLSSYLFVMGLEKLQQLIDAEVRENKWQPISVCMNGARISNLFFADDMVLFAEAAVDQATIITRVLDIFCRASGEKVSLSKSRVFFSSNTRVEVQQAVSSRLGIEITENLGSYLGMPTINGRVTRNTFASIMERFDRRLAGWSTKHLSLAGLATLVQSTPSSMANYSMQTAKILKITCDSLDRKTRRFLWGGDENKRKVHLISWETIQRPKSAGGLGFNSSRQANAAFLTKLG
ncbi:uncharacterized protein LOC141648767 [Silene latifolia]|uniref:uncharacterized protein LOC141648767 n=1 Tax=Silene latifolia TaxID=37657 RepID=UPI003D76A89B